MASVTVTGEGPAYRVAVRDGATDTTHTVTVTPEALAMTQWADADAAALVKASFAFLLEREPASSILRRFNLEVIARYFPEYPAEMARRAPGGRGSSR